jgi:hypothetical protein
VICLVKDIFSIGGKGSRLCPVQKKVVECNGVCVSVFLAEDSSGRCEPYICPVRKKALDKTLNC